MDLLFEVLLIGRAEGDKGILGERGEARVLVLGRGGLTEIENLD